MKPPHSLIASCLAVTAALLATPAAQAADCPNQALREEQPHALALPDCRAYEQVSPVDKGGVDAKGFPGQMQASADGGLVRFYSILPFPETPSNKVGLPTYVSSRRGGGAWSTGSVMPVSPTAQVRGFSEDISEGVVWAEGVSPEGEALQHRTYYMHNISKGTFSRLYAQGEGIEEQALFALGGFSEDDTKMVFESGLHLLPEARAGFLNAYEWDASKPSGQQLSLVGVLPAGEGGAAPAEGSIIGTSAGANLNAFVRKPSFNPGVVSQDGSRVFFTAFPSGRVYVRLDGQTTVAISPGFAEFLGATPDGHYAFYLEDEGLYRYDLDNKEPEPALELTPSAGVLGTLGFSNDGASVYFAATAKLAVNPNPDGEQATTGFETANVYEWQQEGAEPATTTFVAALSNLFEEFGDEGDWRTMLGAKFPALQHSARVTPDGNTLLFTSRHALTGYNNGGNCLNHTKPCQEVFRYQDAHNAAPASLICVSCNPTGSEAVSDALLAGAGDGINGLNEPYLTRNLSQGGQRVFFQSGDSLLPIDTNHATDVYEWEAEGEGSCTTHALDDGCLYLISSGTDPEQSYLGDVSADGIDVFFFTRQPLAAGENDKDSSVDLYDARIDGGPPGCEQTASCPPPPLAPCQGEGCRPAPSAPPAEPFPATASFSGPPNPTQRHHRHRKKTHTKKHNKRSPGRAGADRGGQK